MPHLDTRQPGWWRQAVVYQVYPRSFADSDGDGIGDLPGLLGHLDHLERLGVDVLWLSPFYPSPMVDNGYDVADYRGVDPLFGTMHDIDLLIERLHERGIAFVIDVVLNHSSDQHPWFRASRSSREDDKRDWYWWRPPREGCEPGAPGAEPTNWMSFFGGPAWTFDEQTGEYYLHIFNRAQPDLNWENPQVRHALYDELRFWLARGVDGFRLDVINFISKRLPLVDGPEIPGTSLGSGAASYINGPRLHEFLGELHAEVLAPAGRPLLTVGEMPGVTTAEARLATDPARRELDMVFQFEHMSVDHAPGGRYDPRPLELVRLKQVLARWQTELADEGWNSLYWCNHDQPRPVSRLGADDPIYRELSAKAVATTLHLQRGTPFVYQGEELGLPNHPFEAIEQFDDVETRGQYAQAVAAGADPAQMLEVMQRMSRDHARTPMPWDDSRHAGFTSGTPWLPVHPEHGEINARVQAHDPHSVLHHYAELIRLRHELPVVAEGDFTLLLPDDPRVFAYVRALDDVALLVIANWSTDELAVRLPQADAWAAATLELGNYADGAGRRAPGQLRPWEARVYRRAG